MAAASSGIIVVIIISTRGAGPVAVARRGGKTRPEASRREREGEERGERAARAAQKAARSAEAPRSGKAPAGEAASLVTLQSRRAPVPRVILCFVALYVYLVIVSSCDPDSSLASSGGSGSAFAFECRRGNSQTPRHREASAR